MQSHKAETPQEPFQDGYAMLMCLLFAVTKTVQLFSRRPGTTGTWFFGFVFWIGFGIQLLYYQANVEATGRFDAVPEKAFLLIHIGWFLFHRVRRFFEPRRRGRVHSYDPGVGILRNAFPNWSLGAANFASDAIVSGLMFLACFYGGCPILAGWYFYMPIWLLLEGACSQFRLDYQRQRLDDAQVEADAWTKMLHESQHWQEQYRDRWGDRYS